jgi:hypothetical protein
MTALQKLQFNLGEASTKRGLAMFIAGSLALYHLVFGQGAAPNVDAILERADFWLGVGAQLSGLIGMFVGDEPKTVHIELPPAPALGVAAAPERAGGLRPNALDVPPGPRPDLDERAGFNDQ